MINLRVMDKITPILTKAGPFGRLKLLFSRMLSERSGRALLFGIIIFLFLIALHLVFNPNSEQDIIRAAFDMSYAWDDDGGWLPFIGVLGAFVFSGLLFSLCVNFVQRWVDRMRQGKISFHFYGHVVIIGFGDVVPSIVEQIIRSEKYRDSKIIISSQQDIVSTRDLVYSRLEDKRDRYRVVFTHTVHHSKDSLMKLHTADAKEVFVIGDRSQNDHDSENMHLIGILGNIHDEANSPRIPISIWFEQEASYAAFQLNDIKKEWKERFEFRPYNFYKDWANRMFVSSRYRCGKDAVVYPEIDRDGIGEYSGQHIHVVIIGMNRMGIAVAKETAHLMHYPNFNEKTLDNQTVITFIDDNADSEMRFFQGRHPGYFEIAPTYFWDTRNEKCISFESDMSLVLDEHRDNNFLDVRFQFIRGRIEEPAVKNWLVSQSSDRHQYLNVFVCLHNPSEALGAGLYLPEPLFRTRKDGDEEYFTNIFIRQETSSSLLESLRIAALANESDRSFAHVYPFGMLDSSIDIDSWDTTMAQAFNYIYDYYFNHDNLLPLSLPSLEEMDKPWSSISVSNQWSNIYLADSFEFKLRSIGYRIGSGDHLFISDDQKDVLARVEHNRWNMEKLLIGYRALHNDEWDKAQNEGDKRNDYLKKLKKKEFVHNCIVAYDETDAKKKLSEGEKQLDKNIIETLPMILQYISSK